MRAREKESLSISVVAVLAAIAVATSPSPVLRTLSGLPLIFFLPGYAILRAALHDARPTLAGTVLASGLSIAVTACCGLALHGLRAMNTAGWAFALCGVTVLASCIACFRARSSPSVPDESWSWPPLRPQQALMLVCAAVIAAGAVVMARQGALAHREFAYTEFWMVPTPNVSGSVTIGLKNAEGQSSSYDVEVMLNENVVAVWRSIPLQAGHSWTAEFAMPLGRSGAQKAEAWLFKDGDHRLIYRRVWLKAALED
jgi:uncharacterized membrane protein